MESATSEVDEVQHGGRGNVTRVKPQDPEHDINAKATVTWVLAWTGILVIGLWLMLLLFDTILFNERQTKVETLAPAELQDLREREHLILSGQWKEGTPRKSIEEVMREMAR